MTSSSEQMIIFDLDGTLVDSMNTFADIAAEVMSDAYGISPQLAREAYIRTSGKPFYEQLETLFPGHHENDRVNQAFESAKKQSYLREPFFSDAADTIQHLRQQNFKVAISSNNYQDLVDAIVAHSGISFDVVLGNRPNFAKGEAHFNHLQQCCALPRSNMIFIGDSLHDGERAKAAGVSFVGKSGTFSPEEFRRTFPESPVINKLSELKTLLA